MAKKVIVYDFETNGFWSPLNQPIQVCLKMFDGVSGKELLCYNEFIKCDNPLNGLIVSLTGITDEILREQGVYLNTAFYELKRIFEKNKGAIVVGHNILNFDNRFLNYYMQKFSYGFQLEKEFCFDTMAEMKSVLLGKAYDREAFASYGDWHSKVLFMQCRGGFKLGDSARYYGLEFVEGDLHNAEADVNLNYRVFCKQVEGLGMFKERALKKVVEKAAKAVIPREVMGVLNSKHKKGYTI